MGAAMDVNLLSKDMELNFSNKNDDDDEIDIKPNGIIERDEDPNDEDKMEKFGLGTAEE
jgi:hypothetical protein